MYLSPIKQITDIYLVRKGKHKWWLQKWLKYFALKVSGPSVVEIWRKCWCGVMGYTSGWFTLVTDRGWTAAAPLHLLSCLLAVNVLTPPWSHAVSSWIWPEIAGGKYLDLVHLNRIWLLFALKYLIISCLMKVFHVVGQLMVMKTRLISLVTD